MLDLRQKRRGPTGPVRSPRGTSSRACELVPRGERTGPVGPATCLHPLCVSGIFIANTNMGLIYGQLDNWSRAIEHHKQALQYAVRAGDRQAESLALANLGLMGRSQGDLNTAKVCRRPDAPWPGAADANRAGKAGSPVGLRWC